MKKHIPLLFHASAVYGLLVLLPQYFMEDMVGDKFPPSITHTEYFYGFIGVAVAWQFVYWLIGSDPIRFRPVIPLTVLAKMLFAVPSVYMYLRGGIASDLFFAGACVDILLAAAFLAAYTKIPHRGR